eukprot:Pompholyxophrys_punicea_v1_NODE_582_length_1652_cov_4.927364.p1 type:complete len:154 gc:universal NODE_582_length_1652_cov_4.927364:1424-963(-)
MEMELDTGAGYTIINNDQWKILRCPKLAPADVILKTYNNQQLKLMGKLEVVVEYGSQNLVLPVLVVEGNGPALLERNWLERLKINWSEIFKIAGGNVKKKLDDLLAEFKVLFDHGLGRYTKEVNVPLEDNVATKFCKQQQQQQHVTLLEQQQL